MSTVVLAQYQQQGAKDVPTLPSSPQMNRPGTQLHFIFSHVYDVVLVSYPGITSVLHELSAQ